MTDFYADFHGAGAGGLSAEQYFYKQVFDAFQANTRGRTLPFFNKDLKKIPRELSTGKIINNENSIALEQIASRNGYKSNLWVYGDELNKIQKEVGAIFYKRNASPALCLIKYFGPTHLGGQDLYVSEGGSGKREQYLYNVDSLDDRSKEKVLAHFKVANEADRKYTESNLRAFQSNARLNAEGQNAALKNARDRANTASMQGGTDLRMVTQCHYLHTLSNAIGKSGDIHSGLQGSQAQRQCYEACAKLAGKVSAGQLKPHEAGRMLCTALNAGTEFQRISVAKGYNLENAKKVEELMVAESNRNHTYRRSGGVSY